MSTEEYVAEAIGYAKDTETGGGLPLGVVITNAEGTIVSMGSSSVADNIDVTCHGEIVAIREASKANESTNLDGYILYSTLEPCSMCLSAALWANMSAIYFGAYADDVPANPYVLKKYSAIELANDSQRWDGSQIAVTGGILRGECITLLDDYKNWQKVTV